MESHTPILIQVIISPILHDPQPYKHGRSQSSLGSYGGISSLVQTWGNGVYADRRAMSINRSSSRLRESDF